MSMCESKTSSPVFWGRDFGDDTLAERMERVRVEMGADRLWIAYFDYAVSGEPTQLVVTSQTTSGDYPGLTESENRLLVSRFVRDLFFEMRRSGELLYRGAQAERTIPVTEGRMRSRFGVKATLGGRLVDDAEDRRLWMLGAHFCQHGEVGADAIEAFEVYRGALWPQMYRHVIAERSTKEKFERRLLIESFTEPLAVFDQDENMVLYTNDRMREILGSAQPLAVGSLSGTVGELVAHLRAIHLSGHRSCRGLYRGPQGPGWCEFIWQKLDSTKVNWWMFVAGDISTGIQVGHWERTQALFERVLEHQRSLDSVIARASHDLSNVLLPIRLGLEMSLDDGEVSAADAQRGISQIDDMVGRIRGVLRQHRPNPIGEYELPLDEVMRLTVRLLSPAITDLCDLNLPEEALQKAKVSIPFTEWLFAMVELVSLACMCFQGRPVGVVSGEPEYDSSLAMSIVFSGQSLPVYYGGPPTVMDWDINGPHLRNTARVFSSLGGRVRVYRDVDGRLRCEFVLGPDEGTL